MSTKKEKPGRNHSIDILKGLAILFVLITHYDWQDAERLNLFFPFWINMAVPVFMIVSGYMNSLSFSKKGITSLEKSYLPEVVLPKLVRITLPFAVIFAVNWIFGNHYGMSSDIIGYIKSFIQGGFGPGSYYFPILYQLIFIFPLIYFTVTRYKFKGLVLCGAVNALYEVLQSSYGMNDKLYRLLIFRYILLIAYGVYLSLDDYRPRPALCVASSAVGALYIFLASYCGVKLNFITYWKETSFMAALFIMPIAMLYIRYLSKIRFPPLEFVGKASYSVFLVQMVLYGFASKLVYPYIYHRKYELLLCMALSLAVGIAFHYMITPAVNAINRAVAAHYKKSRDRTGTGGTGTEEESLKTK